MKPSLSTLLSALVCAAALATAACSNNPIVHKQDTAQSARDVSNDLRATENQIDATLASLDNLMSAQPSDLNQAFKRYSADVDKMRAQSKRVDEAAAGLRKDAQNYLANWEASHSKIQNDELRATSEQRRQTVMNRFESLQTTYDHTRTSLEAFTRNLEDVRTAVQNDLTARGVQAVAQTNVVQNAHTSGTQVKTDMAQVRSGTTQLADALAPEAPPSSSNRAGTANQQQQ
jgi:DNA repair exonuclease SbcCD ATPase subunit